VKRFAALDPATTLNGCALAVAEERAGLWFPVALRMWRGQPRRPLDLRNKVIPEAAEIVKGFGCTEWMSDQYAWHDFQLVSNEHALTPRHDSEPLEESFKHHRYVHNGERVALRSSDPEFDEMCGQLAAELAGITERRVGGKTVITLPTAGKLHSDLARAWIRALWLAKAGDPAPAPWGPTVGGSSPYAAQSAGAAWYPRP
jgi:hypothetical protein